MAYTTDNKQYAENVKKWEQVRDCIEDKVEQKREKYIPKPEGISDTNYGVYAGRAIFANFTGQTAQVLKSSMFYRDYTLQGVDGAELPESLQMMVDNFSGKGTNFDDHLKKTGFNVCSVGRFGVLCDYPDTAGQKLSQADINKRGLSAYFPTYRAESIVDWDTQVIDGKEVLYYVKLCERVSSIVKQGNNFTRDDVDLERELFIDDDGFYAQKVTVDGTTQEIKQPLKGNGERFDFIPFQFINADDNTPDCGPIPLYKISTLNIGHFREDANRRQNSFYFSVPTATVDIGDMDAQEFRTANNMGKNDGITFGGTAYILQKGKIELIQAKEGSVSQSIQQDDESAMVKLGAQIVMQGQNETAEAARIRKGTGMVTLGDMAGNIEEAYINLINWGMMMNNPSGEPDEFEFNMSRQFFDDRLSPQMLQQLINMNIQGKYPDDDLYKQLKKDNLTTFDTMLEYKEALGTDTGDNSLNIDE
tara:strand:- start:2128 stop:3555 length:1428 start_codon:yes stop_codon:yes gene_type:complete